MALGMIAGQAASAAGAEAVGSGINIAASGYCCVQEKVTGSCPVPAWFACAQLAPAIASLVSALGSKGSSEEIQDTVAPNEFEVPEGEETDPLADLGLDAGGFDSSGFCTTNPSICSFDESGNPKLDFGSDFDPAAIYDTVSADLGPDNTLGFSSVEEAKNALKKGLDVAAALVPAFNNGDLSGVSTGSLADGSDGSGANGAEGSLTGIKSHRSGKYNEGEGGYLGLGGRKAKLKAKQRFGHKDSLFGKTRAIGLDLEDAKTGRILSLFERATRRYVGDDNYPRGFILARFEARRKSVLKKNKMRVAKNASKKDKSVPAPKSGKTSRAPARTSVKIQNNLN